MERDVGRKAQLDASKLDRTEIIGMVAAALPCSASFSQWYSLSTDPSVVQRGNDPANWACGVGGLELQRLGDVPDPPRGC